MKAHRNLYDDNNTHTKHKLIIRQVNSWTWWESSLIATCAMTGLFTDVTTTSAVAFLVAKTTGFEEVDIFGTFFDEYSCRRLNLYSKIIYRPQARMHTKIMILEVVTTYLLARKHCMYIHFFRCQWCGNTGWLCCYTLLKPRCQRYFLIGRILCLKYKNTTQELCSLSVRMKIK